MKNKTSKVWLLFVILFAFVLFRTISSSPTSEEVTEISYPELVRMIENGSASNVELDQTTPIVTITTSESVIYTSTIPNEEIFLNFVQKQIESGKDINISTTQNTDSLSKASSIISFIVWGYFGFMIFLIV